MISSARPGPAATTAADRVTYGAVHLDVTDLEASLRFWAGAVGLSVLGRDDDGAARLGVEDAELVVLHPGATSAVPRGHTGLYHLAIHLPSEAEFARSLGRLSAARVRQAPTDHVMHWATYAWDPDGIGLELSFETLDRFDSWVTGHGDLGVRHTDGRVTSGRDPLDLDEVFSYLGDEDFARPMPAGTRIGHVHLHVADIDEAVGVATGLGFELNHVMDGFGMADLRAGGEFPHRLAVNVWQGEGAPPPPAGTAGLRHFELRSGGETRRVSSLLQQD
jgi:catechol 2,3-dioxygenase